MLTLPFWGIADTRKGAQTRAMQTSKPTNPAPRGARFLYISGAISVLYGVGLAAAAAFAGPELLAPMFDLLLSEPPSGPLPASTLFGLAVAGGILAGWGAMLESLADALRREGTVDAAALGKAVAIGTATWFVVDSTASVLTGAPANVLGNLAFLALLLPPAWMLMRSETRSAVAPGSAVATA